MQEPARARKTDPSTSHEAAAKVNMTGAIAVVTRIISSGATYTDEMIHQLHVSKSTNDDWRAVPYTEQSIRAARLELVRRGDVIMHSNNNKTKRGNRCRSWKWKPK